MAEGRLDGKIAVVTGAGSGFGEGIAKRFAAEGAKVLIADIDREGGERVAGEIGNAGGEARFVETDVADAAASRAMIAAAVEACGGLDIAVLNAAIGMSPMPLVDTPDEFFDRIFRINVRSVFLGAKHAVPALRERGGGSIIVTVSTAALRPRPWLAVYNATKGALVPLCKALALEVAGDNIRVNGICPVAGETAMLKEFIGDADPVAARAAFVATVPLGRLSRPADVAAAALFFADDESGFVTGTMLEVDGGRCI
jgi:3-oxoacyl-[acyl-carrier protein] reductase